VVNDPLVTVENLTIRYGERAVVRDVSLSVPRNGILGIVGPAGSGKSSMLTALNRTLELQPHASQSGRVTLDGVDVRSLELSDLRRRVAMVLPLPVGLPMSVYENVAFAPRMVGVSRRAELDVIVERCLTQAALWDEVKDRLDMLGTRLSGGQQQRLTLARALSTDPDVLCLDEFSIAIDPVTTMRIEAVLSELKSQMAIIMVTNLLMQARRIADVTAFMLNGELVEIGKTGDLFVFARDQRTSDYLAGKFG
jgi:phosphate transport system ATP-binding protein